MGLITYFFFFVFYVFVIFNFGGSDSEDRDFKISFWHKQTGIITFLMALAGALAGTYAFLQFCGYDFVLWQEAQLYSRAISSFGQPNFLASFLLLSLSVSVYNFFFISNFKRRSLLFLLIILQLVGLVVSGSRAAWLSASLVSVVVITWWLWQRFHWRSLFIIPFLTAALIFFFSVLMPGRLSALIDFKSGSTALRFYFYQAAVPVIAANPWIGTGLENGGEMIVREYIPDWGLLMNINSYTDQVHNIFLDIIIQTGIIGFIVWLLLHLFFFWQCWLLSRHAGGRSFALAATAAMSAYILALFFGLADIASSFYFWILAALVSAGNLNFSIVKIKGSAKSFIPVISWPFIRQRFILFYQKIVVRFLAAIMILAAVGQIYFSWQSWQADYYFLQISFLLPKREYFTIDVLYSYLQSSASNPIGRAFYQRSLSSFALADLEYLSDLSSQRLVGERLAEIALSLPDDAYEDKVARARLHCFLKEDATGQNELLSLLMFSPYRPVLYFNLGQCWQMKKEYRQAITVFDQALAILPDFSDSRINQPHLNYLYFYAYRLHLSRAFNFQMIDDNQSALLAYREAYSYYPEDISNLKNIADTYFRQSNYKEAIAVLQHAYVRQPGAYQWPLALAALYQLTGDTELSDLYRSKAASLAPSIVLSLPKQLIYR
jgi:tetratricopeptide (TPR) repeat protein